MKITRDSSLREVAFCVCTELARVGVTAVLTGGSAATIRAPKAIQSYDLDFVLEVYSERQAPAKALEGLGFRREGHDYRHHSSRCQLEFPPGPLAVGDERIEHWDTLKKGRALLHVITATDSCRDRLAAFSHFRDRSALDQACAVYTATKRRVDVKLIRAWSKREGMLEAFMEFARRARRRMNAALSSAPAAASRRSCSTTRARPRASSRGMRPGPRRLRGCPQGMTRTITRTFAAEVSDGPAGSPRGRMRFAG